MLVPSLALTAPRTEDPRGRKGPVPSGGYLHHVFPPLKESLHWIVLSPLPTRQAAEPCIYVHTQCLSPASSISLPLHRPRKEKGHAKAGLTLPPRVLHSSLPAQPLVPQCVPNPKDPGRQQAESRSWVCLILIIRFNFSFASFSAGPCRSPGPGKRRDLCSYFHTFPVQSRVGALHPYPNHPSPPSCWVSVCMFPLLWWEIV